MKEHIKFTSKIDIKNWLDENHVENYTIHDDLTVDAISVNLSQKNLTFLPVQFNVVNSTFDISNNQLTNLKGSPHTALSFFCQDNFLVSLEGAPQWVPKEFDCSYNTKLMSLKYAPQKVGQFICDACSIQNLKHFNCEFQKFSHDSLGYKKITELREEYLPNGKILLDYETFLAICEKNKLEQNMKVKTYNQTKIKI